MTRRRNNSPIDNFAPERLREHRKRNGLTTETLATLAAIPRPNVVAFESGRRNPSFATVIALAAALDINPLELTAGGDRPTLADLRLAARLTRHELAATIDVSYATWYAIETGRRNLTASVAERAAQALHVDVATVHNAYETTRHEARLRGHPTTTARHFALQPHLEPHHAALPATSGWTHRRIRHMLQVAGIDPDTVTVVLTPTALSELTGITVGANTHGISSRHPNGPVLYVDSNKAGSRTATERLIAHEIGHLKWPSLHHRPRFFERVQELLDAAA